MVLMVTAVILVALGAVFCGVYYTRFQSMKTAAKLTDYTDGYNLYRMDIRYAYDLDRIIRHGTRDNDRIVKNILREAMPFLPVHITSPDYSCSAFGVRDTGGDALMGRNYDFDENTSALLVTCAPKDGYRSVGMMALNHLETNALDSLSDRLSGLAAPFICLDGMNEKGVSIAILMLDSESVVQRTEKPDIFTTLAVRLVLDRAATTQEAVDLLKQYDMFAVSGGDYQFYLNDASGDGRVIEYDCHSETRDLTDVPVRTATNFYHIYIDKVLPNQKNGIYGHGRERYDLIEKVFSENEGQITRETAWEALIKAWQMPKPDEKTSNTQWSVLYNNSKKTAEIILRRKQGEVVSFSLGDNRVQKNF